MQCHHRCCRHSGGGRAAVVRQLQNARQQLQNARSGRSSTLQPGRGSDGDAVAERKAAAWMAMPRVSRREDVVIHAPTGSGKTLAYLVPILSRLEPRVPFQLLVLVPSRELAVQVAGQMEQLFRRSTSAPPRLSLILSAVTPKATADPVDAAAAAQLQYGELLRQEPEVLVATPPALMRVLRVRDEESEAPGFGFDADADADGEGDGEGSGAPMVRFSSQKPNIYICRRPHRRLVKKR